MNNTEATEPTNSTSIPDTYIIILGVAIFAFLLTYLVPQGVFEVKEIAKHDGSTHRVLIPDSFEYVNEDTRGAPFFAQEGKIGFLNFAFEGLVSGSKWGASIGVFAFIIIAGGAFGIITATGAIDRALLRVINKSQKADLFAIPLLFFIFSLGGAIFGMGEEAIPFVLILVPVLVKMGYDSITGILITYIATQVGFACSWMNPFSLSIAQSIAEIPIMSGAGVRITIWCFFTTLGMTFTTLYALSIKREPSASLAFHSDGVFRDKKTSDIETQLLTLGDWIILGILLMGIVWIVYGVTFKSYYLPEIATQFFAMGLAAALAGSIFKLNNMSANSAAESFKQGAAQLLPAAMIVAFASGIVLLLGSKNANEASVLNTILFSAANMLEGLPSTLAAISMFCFQSIFNFFMTSGSGQAALTMPLMAPLSDLVGINRQVAVLAFQLGDGFTNILVPTSASLMGCLGAARLDWSIWLRFIIKPFIILMGLAMMTVAIAELINFS